jgi:hypothetical protein
MQKNKKNTLDLSDIINKNSDMVDYINIINDIDNEIKEIDEIDEPLSEYIFKTTKDTNITTEVTEGPTVDNAMNVAQNTNVTQIPINNENIDFDSVSVSSDITFGNDTDKTMTKKYKNMNVERLREECKNKSLNSEGTKAFLISRILEYNKKQK